MQIEGGGHGGAIDLGVAMDGGIVAHASQQAVGDAGGAAAAAGHLPGGRCIQRNRQQGRGAPHDRLEVGLFVELEPLDQPEAVPQR